MDKLINGLHHFISYCHTQRLPMSTNVHAIEICENVYEIDTFLSMPSSSTRYLFYNISRSIVSDRFDLTLFRSFSIVTGSKGRRSVGCDFTRTLDSSPFVGVHPDPARRYRRAGRLVAAHQSPRGAQSLRHAVLLTSRRSGTLFFFLTFAYFFSLLS